MPIKSKAQRRKFAELLVTGKITPEVYERWNREAGSAELPERLHPERQAKARKKAPRKSTTDRKTKTSKTKPIRATTRAKSKGKARAKKRT